MNRAITFILCFAALASAAVPSWVQPGVTATYDGYAAFVNNGQYSNAVQTLVAIQVTSVAGNTVSGTTRVTEVTTGISQDYPWTCQEGGICAWRFWVDPANPAASLKGPNGEPFSVAGRQPYSYGGRNWDATLLAYQGQNGVEYHATIETRTGLLLAYAEIHPSQQTYIYFKEINADLAGYRPPAQPLVPGGVCAPAGLILFGAAFAVLVAARRPN